MALRPEDILKGRMAETLVSELLRTCGNKVYRFGYETVLQNLTQLEQTFDRYTKTAEIIRSIPDLVVVNKEGKPFFVEVKFRTYNSKYLWFEKRKWAQLRTILDYWNAIFILVTTEYPYFRVFNITPDKKKSRFIPIEQCREFTVTSEALEEFNRLVEKHCLPGSK